MKKLVGITVGSIATLLIVGFSFADLGEYTQAVRHRVNRVVKDSIPMSVEIDRMEVLLAKLDDQVASQKYLVAKANINLQEAEAELERQQSKTGTLLTEMKHLRSWIDACEVGTVHVGRHQVSRGEISKALRHKLSAYKESEATSKACEESVVAQRNACDALERQFTEWENERKLLGHRLEKLKAQLVAQQLKKQSTESRIDDSTLARATELADQIEKEIRIAEAQTALGTSPLDQILSEEIDEQTASVESEVDEILNDTKMVGRSL